MSGDASTRPRLLAFIRYYLPGYKFGGPTRTLANMVEQLGDELDFRIVTLDRDDGDTQTYEGVMPGHWHDVGKAHVMYLERNRCSWSELRRLISETEHDVLYLNSLFDPVFTLRPLLLGYLERLSRKPTVVAPRGELAHGALAFKSLKKRTFLTLAKLLRLYERVHWQASSEHEAEDVRRVFGTHAPIGIAMDLTARSLEDRVPAFVHEKQANRLRVLFLSRIARPKNLGFALEVLRQVTGEVELDIYGPVDDPEYWNECRAMMEQMPSHVAVHYRGSLPHDKVSATMAEHDVFLLPSVGENFGHVIHEALLAGCPVIISDRTPWRGLEQDGVGWDLPLDRPESFVAALERCLEMGPATHREWSDRAKAYGTRCMLDRERVEQNLDLFRTALAACAEEP